MKRQPTEGEKIFANDTQESKMYKATRATQYQKEKIRNWAELNRYFSKENMQITVREIKMEEVLFRFQRQESRAGL